MEKRPSVSEHTSENRHETISDWPGRTVLQIYPNTFNEERPDGVEHTGRGSILGIIDKLDYLDELGIRAIWLSPFYASPMKDGGYDISNPTEVDPGLGTLEDIDNLIRQCHERDVKIIVDLVPNHTSDQHEWFRQSVDDPDGEFGDFYIWQDPKKLQPGEPALPHNIVAGDRLEGLPEGYTVPNNWSSIFSIPEREKLKEMYGDTIPDGVEVPARTAWVWHQGRQQFYLAEFTKEQPDLNWNNPTVRNAMTDVMRFWLDRGVDGFRVDVVNHIGKDPALTDEELVPDGQYDKNNDNPHDQWEQRRLVSYWPRLEPYATELISTLDEYPDRDTRLIFEDWITALSGDIDLLSRLRPDKATVFNFKRLLKTNQNNWDAQTHKRLLDEYYEQFSQPDLAGSVPNQVDSNHDIDRVVTRLGSNAARTAALIKLTLPGTPYIFQGEEGGFSNLDYAHIPPQRRKDDDLGLRDGERSPIMWDDSPNAGFSYAPEERLWLPIDPNYPKQNLADQMKDPLSAFSLFRAAIKKRNSSEALSRGNYVPMETDHRNVLAFGRSHPVKRQQYVTLANFSGGTSEVAVLNPHQILGRVVLSTVGGLAHGRHSDLRFDQGRIILNPNETLLIESVT